MQLKQTSRFLGPWLCLIAAWIGPPKNAFVGKLCAQDSSFQSSQNALSPLDASPLSVARPLPPNGQAGGGSLADFTELIGLVQTMVKSNWDVDGGEDNIQPYPNGVWIDPSGKLNRQVRKGLDVPTKRPITQEAISVIELPQFGSLQTKEALRWVSLVELEEKLKTRLASNEMASPAMELLGGLTRIDFVARDPVTQEWCLGGPAGDLVMDRKGNLIGRTTGLPPVLLEDLMSVAPLVLNGRGPLGCSIDPVPERLKAVAEMAVSPLATRSLAQHASKWCERLTETLGDQQATVFGLPEDSPTGIALLIADEHMKRIGLGLEKGPAKLLSYWEEGEKRGGIKASGLIRWWFALRDDIRIGVDESSSVFAFESPTVRVMSQRQFMDQTGARHEANDQDLAADAFASGFTENFAELQSMYPMYGRLRHIFDLCVAMRLIREETQLGHGVELSLLRDRSVQPHSKEPLKWIPSTAAWRKTSNGRVSAIVSGGVTIDVRNAPIAKLPGRTSTTSIEPFVFE
jgi:hypothetical protein